jgi:major membrane immunogen (membrane-anchored lipoprotein)
MTQMNTQIYQHMVRVHTELLDFTGRRLRADIEVAQKLTGGGNLDDAVEAVYGFQRQIISDYADEASALVKMSTSMAEDFIQKIEDDVKEGAEEVEVDVKKVIYDFQRKMRKISSDYADEASELVKMSTSMAEDLIQEVEDGVKKVVGEGEVDVKEGAAEASEPVKTSTSMAGHILIQNIEDDLKEGADEASGAVVAEDAPPEPQAAETGEEVAAKGPVITLKGPPKTTGENDLQHVILDALSGSGEAMTLAEIATKTGKKHFAALIGPMRSLRKMGMVVKEDKVYRLDR